MTILVMFQLIRFRDFKTFYCGYVQLYLKNDFSSLSSYNRFIELIPKGIFHLIVFTQTHCGTKTGIYYIDSSCLPVCHLKRSRRHKTFDNLAQYGRRSVGWFFGLKIHIVINNKGEVIALKYSTGSQHDNQSAESLLRSLEGLAFGDKGYLSKKLFDILLSRGLKLIT